MFCVFACARVVCSCENYCTYIAFSNEVRLRFHVIDVLKFLRTEDWLFFDHHSRRGVVTHTRRETDTNSIFREDA